MKKAHFTLPTMGVSSLLGIFSVLCLVCFALLSISTVQSQKNLSDASAKTVSDYYTADAQAEEILSSLRRGELPHQVEREGDIYRYICPISQTQQLEVEVRLKSDTYTILRWQAVSTLDWVQDDHLAVWPGQ